MNNQVNRHPNTLFLKQRLQINKEVDNCILVGIM